MKKLTVKVATICLIIVNCRNIVARATGGTVEEEAEAAKFLEGLEQKFSRVCNEAAVKSWNFQTNITAETEEISVIYATIV